MKHGLLLALLALAGCQTIQRHPYISGFVATSLVIGAKALDGRRDGLTRSGDMPAICRTNADACR